jgi:hypothetical protein
VWSLEQTLSSGVVHQQLSIMIQGEVPMSTNKSTATSSKSSASLSLDTWAVIAALVLALAVKLDILKNVSW